MKRASLNMRSFAHCWSAVGERDVSGLLVFEQEKAVCASDGPDVDTCKGAQSPNVARPFATCIDASDIRRKQFSEQSAPLFSGTASSLREPPLKERLEVEIIQAPRRRKLNSAWAVALALRAYEDDLFLRNRKHSLFESHNGYSLELSRQELPDFLRVVRVENLSRDDVS